MARYQFAHHGGVYRPVVIVASCGWIDMLMSSISYQTVQNFYQAESKKDKELTETHAIRWMIHQASKLAKEAYSNSGKAWLARDLETYVADNFGSVDATLKTRAKHYRDSSHDNVEVVIAKVTINGRYPSTLPVLCVPVDETARGEDPIAESLEQALCDYRPSENGDGEVPVRGHNMVYGPIFGGNPQYLLSKVMPEKLMSDSLYRALSKAKRVCEDHLRALWLADLKTAILSDPQIQQAGMVELKDEEGKTVATVPRLALSSWAVTMHKKQHQGLYAPYAPPGMKLNFDNRYHSDWMVAGGVDLEEGYRSSDPIQQAAWRWAYDYQRAQSGVEYMVLSNQGAVQGPLRYATPDNAASIRAGDIVVLPHPGVQYQLHLEQACREPGKGGAIVLEGHQAAHLCKVGRERAITLVMVPDVKQRFIEGQIVVISPEKGTVSAVTR